MPISLPIFYPVFHKMAYELHGMLTSAVSLTTWEKVMPAYGGGAESFLENVVTPIYIVIKKVLFFLLHLHSTYGVIIIHSCSHKLTRLKFEGS